MKLRSELILVPLTILGLALLGDRIHLPFAFEDVFGVRGDITPYRYLACLAACVVGAIVIYRIVQDK